MYNRLSAGIKPLIIAKLHKMGITGNRYPLGPNTQCRNNEIQQGTKYCKQRITTHIHLQTGNNRMCNTAGYTMKRQVGVSTEPITPK